MIFNGELVDGPSITLFTAPRPFVGTVGERQALAIRSWLGLSPDISVVLFSQDSTVFSFAELLSHRVSVEPNIDFTYEFYFVFLVSLFFASTFVFSLGNKVANYINHNS